MPRLPDARTLALCSVLFVGLVAAAPNKDERGLSRLSDVTIEAIEGEVIVGIRGSRAPSFASFSMQEPHRVVVDWAGSSLAGGARNDRFERGLIRGIATSELVKESDTISRVTIELAQEARYRVETQGQRVLVRFEAAHLPAEAVVAPAAQPAALAHVSAAGATRTAPTPEGPLTEPRAPPVATLPLPKKGLEDPPILLLPTAGLPTAVAVAPTHPPRVPRAVASRPPEPASTQATLTPAAASAGARSRGDAPKPAVARTQPEVPSPLVARAAKDEVRTGPKTPSRDEPATARLAEWRPGKKAAPVLVVAQAEAPPSGDGREVLKAREDADFDPGPRVMTYIGFRQKQRGSEVFVRCDGRPRYRVAEESDSQLVLELVDTRVNVRNNERALDTSYFPSAVTKVQAKAGGSGTRIVVDLRERVPYQIKRVGTTVSIELAAPAGG